MGMTIYSLKSSNKMQQTAKDYCIIRYLLENVLLINAVIQ